MPRERPQPGPPVGCATVRSRALHNKPPASVVPNAMRNVCDATAPKSMSKSPASTLLNTASADANRPPKTSSSGNASRVPAPTARKWRSAPPLGNSSHRTSRPTSAKAPTHAPTAAAKPACTYSHEWRPRMATPRRLRPARRQRPRADFGVRRGQVRGPEIGPVAGGEGGLGVRAPPQQEVAEALPPAGADEEVDVGEEEARLDRGAAGVVDEEPEGKRVIARGRLLGRLDRHAEEGGEPVPAADDLEAHAVRDEPRGLAPQVAGEEAHQGRDLVGGPLPVVGGGREQGELADAEAGGRLDDAAHCPGAGAVTGGARQAAVGRPASVAVHDDRDVQRSTLHCKVRSHKKRRPA